MSCSELNNKSRFLDSDDWHINQLQTEESSCHCNHRLSTPTSSFSHSSSLPALPRVPALPFPFYCPPSFLPPSLPPSSLPASSSPASSLPPSSLLPLSLPDSQLVWAPLWLRESLPHHELGQNAPVVVHLRVWHLYQCQDLPQCHTE